MIRNSIVALRGAGHDVSALDEVIRTPEMAPGTHGMSLISGSGDAAGNAIALHPDAFASQEYLNHVMEEELVHILQARPVEYGPGSVLELELNVNPLRKFPWPPTHH